MNKIKILILPLALIILTACSKDKLYDYPSSDSEKTLITAVRLLNEAGESVINSYEIDNDNSSVTIIVNPGQSLNKLVATATVSEGVIVEPIMGTYKDFSSTVTYTLIAGNRSTKRDWSFIVKH